MNLGECPFWPPKWHSYRSVEHADNPIFNRDFQENGILESVDVPDPSRALVVTIHVRHKDYIAPVTGDFALAGVGTERRLRTLLCGLTGKSLTEIAEQDFEPSGG